MASKVKLYNCIREAYELAEVIADQLALILAAMDYGEGSYDNVLLGTYLTLQQIHDLVERVKQAVKIMRFEDVKQLDL